MTPKRLHELMSTKSPGLEDFAINRAITTLLMETSPTKRRRSPYAIPRIVEGLPPDQQERIIRRSIELMRTRQA